MRSVVAVMPFNPPHAAARHWQMQRSGSGSGAGAAAARPKTRVELIDDDKKVWMKKTEEPVYPVQASVITHPVILHTVNTGRTTRALQNMQSMNSRKKT